MITTKQVKDYVSSVLSAYKGDYDVDGIVHTFIEDDHALNHSTAWSLDACLGEYRFWTVARAHRQPA
jgi:hypothetical protein